MIVLKIENVKEFMSHLFAGEMFDRFHVNGCEVTTFVEIQTDGRCHSEWFDTDERVEDSTGLVTWQQLKTMIFSLIKGKKTPERLRIDFCHYMNNGDMGSLRVQYEKEELLLYTGYMQKDFSMDKEKQREWDENCIHFLEKNKIASTQLD
ncbi:MAG: hypothetical protein J1F02_10615 [Lachnospiraceae bacterium]|nr:hypothetical protein [Lachnospiraceae bacterium]